jgi:hypothetical protein
MFFLLQILEIEMEAGCINYEACTLHPQVAQLVQGKGTDVASPSPLQSQVG